MFSTYSAAACVSYPPRPSGRPSFFPSRRRCEPPARELTGIRPDSSRLPEPAGAENISVPGRDSAGLSRLVINRTHEIVSGNGYSECSG